MDIKLFERALDVGRNIKTPIALLSTVALVLLVLVAFVLSQNLPSAVEMSQWLNVAYIFYIFLVTVGILALLFKFILIIWKPVAPQPSGAIGHLPTLATFAKRSSNLVDDFCFHSINNLAAVKTACVDGRNLETDAQTVLSYIRSSTRFANMIVSVDFEIGSWSKILKKSDIDEAANKFNIPSKIRDEFYPSTEIRFNDFHEIWSATLERLKNLGNSAAEPFVTSHPGILRTFVIWDQPEFTWIDWAILKKLSEAESYYAKQANRQIMVNKFVFQSKLVRDQPNWAEDLRDQEDIILFFEANRNDLDLEELDPAKLPAKLICSGVRETLHPESPPETKSFLLFQQHAVTRAYTYALGLWMIAEDINDINLKTLETRVVKLVA